MQGSLVFFLGRFRCPPNRSLCRKSLSHVALRRLVETRGPPGALPLSSFAYRHRKTQGHRFCRHRAPHDVCRPGIPYSLPQAIGKNRRSGTNATSGAKWTIAFCRDGRQARLREVSAKVRRRLECRNAHDLHGGSSLVAVLAERRTARVLGTTMLSGRSPAS